MSSYLRQWPAPKTFATAGDEIKGTLVDWDGTSEKYPVLHIRTADGMVRVVRVTQVRLHERLAELLPEIGDRIRIRYDGEAPHSVPGLNPVKEFTVHVAPKGSPPSDNAKSPSGEVQNKPVPEAGK